MYPISYESLQKSLPNNHVSLQQSTADGTDTRRLTDSFMSVISISQPKLNPYSPPPPHSFYNLSSYDFQTPYFIRCTFLNEDLHSWPPTKPFVLAYLSIYSLCYPLPSALPPSKKLPWMLKILLTLWYPLPCFGLPESAANWEYALIRLSDNILSSVSLYDEPLWEIMQMTLGDLILILILVDAIIVLEALVHIAFGP
jgi:hypothetical protein